MKANIVYTYAGDGKISYRISLLNMPAPLETEIKLHFGSDYKGNGVIRPDAIPVDAAADAALLVGIVETLYTNYTGTTLPKGQQYDFDTDTWGDIPAAIP